MTTRQQVKKGQDGSEAARGVAEWLVLYQAYNAVFKLTELTLLPHNLSLPQLHLLGALKSGGGILTTGEIGRAMVKASQTITGLVDRLETQELVERHFDRSDRRKTWVRITEKGERKLAEATPTANRLAEELSSVLTDEELKSVDTLLAKVRGVALDRLLKTLGRL
ncbi:MAG: MarR family transcriptional regulator [Chloroflexota bacterium]|nr:MarR family transcriptional regulator [Chloroflexota bacterium]